MTLLGTVETYQGTNARPNEAGNPQCRDSSNRGEQISKSLREEDHVADAVASSASLELVFYGHGARRGKIKESQGGTPVKRGGTDKLV